MVKLKIININDYEYSLKDEEEHNYIINMEFFDVDENPRIGDYIYINKELLNPKYDGYSTSYTFGSLENKYGKENIQMEDIDVIKVTLNNKEIYLKRQKLISKSFMVNSNMILCIADEKIYENKSS